MEKAGQANAMAAAITVSSGIGARINLLGFAIIEFDYAYAFQRDRWMWQLGFVPGF